MLGKYAAGICWTYAVKSRFNIYNKHIITSIFLCNDAIGIRHAGHSKWQNIRHTKAVKDLAKNKLYNLYIRRLRNAVKGNKSLDPKLNRDLGNIMEQAKKDNVASSTLNRQIEKIRFARLNPKPVMFEYRGSKGFIMIILASTENITKTRYDIGFYLRKTAIKSVENGSVISAFEYKGFVKAKPPPDVSDPNEKCIDDAIEVGAEEVTRSEEEPELFVFSCSGGDVNPIKSKLEAKNYTVEDAESYYVPRHPIELEEEELNNYSDLMHQIEEGVDEVDRIIVNIA